MVQWKMGAFDLGSLNFPSMYEKIILTDTLPNFWKMTQQILPQMKGMSHDSSGKLRWESRSKIAWKIPFVWRNLDLLVTMPFPLTLVQWKVVPNSKAAFPLPWKIQRKKETLHVNKNKFQAKWNNMQTTSKKQSQWSMPGNFISMNIVDILGPVKTLYK